VLRFSDARNFGRTITGLLLFAGPVLLIVASLVGPKTDYGNSVKDHLKELASVQAHKGTYLASGLLFLAATACLMFVGVCMIKYFRGPRGVTLGQVAGVLLALGSTVGMGWYAMGAIEYQMVTSHSEPLLNSGSTKVVYATLMHASDNAGTFAPLIILFLVGVVLGQVLLGVAALRTRVVPVWAASLLIVSGPLTFFSEGKVGSIVSGAVMLVALGALAVRAFQMSDEEWDAPLVRGGVPASVADAAPTPAPAA
jgi:hypothetical protein